MFFLRTNEVREKENIYSSRKNDPLQQHISTDDDDPLKKRESEKLVPYIDHVNDLFDFAQYEAAAIHAATSPMAILRTPQDHHCSFTAKHL